MIPIGMLFLPMAASPGFAQVQSCGYTGFELRISKTTDKSPEDCNRAFIKEIGQWWASDHTWSGDAKNMSIDLDRNVLLERLPEGGFCNHMALEHLQPGKLILLTGGLGPLKEMGLNGTLSIRFTEKDGKTSIQVKYIVQGYCPNGFDELSAVVHEVLDMQMNRWVAFCETGSPTPTAK